MTMQRVTEAEVELIAKSCEQAAPLLPGNFPGVHIGSAASFLRRLLAERDALEEAAAQDAEIAAAVTDLAAARREWAKEALDKLNEIQVPDTYADRYAAMSIWLHAQAEGGEGE